MKQKESIIDLINIDEDEEMDIHFVYPYECEKFEQWLRQEMSLTDRTIAKHIDQFMDGCEAADDELGMWLYELLELFMENVTDLTKGLAVNLVETYHNFIKELVEEGRSDLSKAPRAFELYRQFLEDLINHPDKINVKELEIPYKEEFLSWLEKDLHKGYFNAKKDVSALQSAKTWIAMLFNFEDYDLFNRLAEMNNKADRQRVLDLLRQYKNDALPENFQKLNLKKKTVENGLSCLQTYILFLNGRDK